MGSPVALAFVSLDSNPPMAAPALPRLSAGHMGEKLKVIDIPGKGRGVVAGRPLMAGELIEIAPVIVVSAADKATLSTTIIEHYGYDWLADGTGLALALGCGSLYNHSFEPNAVYKKDFKHHTIEYRALIDMLAGTEICVNYNGDPTDRTPLWFDVVG